ncbi:MAG: hypothetical protein IT424_04130 [Pirellulales bacterium]|nr:hypothetical protein [Pirellulales bacterium]
MGRSFRNCEVAKTKRRAPSLARSLAPEEIRRGDFVALLYEVSEWPSWFWCDDGLHGREEPVRILHLPHEEPQPLRVCESCLPLVLVKAPSGEMRTLDVRKCRLARLGRRYGRRAWNAYRRQLKTRRLKLPLC